MASICSWGPAEAPRDAAVSVLGTSLLGYEPVQWTLQELNRKDLLEPIIRDTVGKLMDQGGATMYGVMDNEELVAVGFLSPNDRSATVPPLAQVPVRSGEPPSGEEADAARWWKVRLVPFMRRLEAEDTLRNAGRFLIVSLVGCSPTHQHKGHAKRLCQAFVEAADAAQLPMYLITGNNLNERLYGKFGFAKISSHRLGKGEGSVEMRGMHRKASSAELGNDESCWAVWRKYFSGTSQGFKLD